MSLSKPVRHCPSNCRGCATFAAFGGECFPHQPPGSPLAQCYEYARAAGIINGPSSSNADLVPAPLSIPPKSAKRLGGESLHASSAQSAESREDALIRAAAIATLTAADTKAMSEIPGALPQRRIYQALTREQLKLEHDLKQLSLRKKQSQVDNAVSSSSPPYAGLNYDVHDLRYPLGHAYIPPGVLPLPDDPLFTITTNGERYATTFVGTYAMRMYDAYRASGIDMHTYEVRGEWEKLGVKRWIFSLGADTDMGKVKQILVRGKDVVMAAASEKISTFKMLKEYENMGIAVESKRVEMEIAFRDVEKVINEGGGWDRRPLVDGPLNNETMRRLLQEILEVKLDPVDWEGPDWIGSTASISALQPRQRTLWVGYGRSEVIANGENDETACTSYVRLAPTKQMDFSWYQRRKPNEKLGHQWPHFMRWIMGDGTIRDFSMQEVYDSLTGKFSLLKNRFMYEDSAANFASKAARSQWRTMARDMINFEWFWDEDKRILVQGYSGHNDYEKDCDYIDEQMTKWKESVEDELEANRKAVKSGNLTKKETKYAMIGEYLLKQWKEGPGIMVAKTPSEEKWEGAILGPHTTDGASHINYLNARIAFATRQRDEIERLWSEGAATEEDIADRKDVVAYIDVLENLKDDLGELNRREETGLSPIFKDKDTRKRVNEWERECREEMRLWERETQEEDEGQNFNFQEPRTFLRAQ